MKKEAPVTKETVERLCVLADLPLRRAPRETRPPALGLIAAANELNRKMAEGAAGACCRSRASQSARRDEMAQADLLTLTIAQAAPRLERGAVARGADRGGAPTHRGRQRDAHAYITVCAPRRARWPRPWSA